MKANYNIRSLELVDNCTCISKRKWDAYMDGAVKANGNKIRALIKKFLPDLYEELALQFHNPYEHQCKRTETHFIYVWSEIEYFLKFEL